MSNKARMETSRRVVRRLREDPLFAAFISERSEGAGSLLMALPSDTMGTIFEWVAEVEAPAIVCFEETLEDGTSLSVLIFREKEDVPVRDIQEFVKVAPTITVAMFSTFAREKGTVGVHLADPNFTVYVPDAMATL